jgi:toxin ParE1/3/4
VRVAIKPRARVDLLAIREWSEVHWGESRAGDFLEGLIEAVERLADHPGMGRPRDALLPGLRSIRYRGYIIFYLVEIDRPVVVAVVHERRNFAALDFAERIEGE